MSLFDTGIRPSVDAWLLKKSKEVRSYGEYWSASSAGYCMRKQIFERLGVPPVKEDARKTRVFAVGDVFHKFMQDITKEAGLSIAQELELQDEELMIRGHIDDLVLVGGGPYDEPYIESFDEDQGAVTEIDRPKHLILYDYKSTSSRSFSYSKGREMSFYHHMQLGTYLYMLRKLNPKEQYWPTNNGEPDLTESRILRISKDDLRMEEQQLMWSPQLEKEVIGYWSTLNGYWKNRKLPRCTCADYEGGFLAKEAYNPFFYLGEPCSLAWLEHCKKTELIKGVT